MWHRANDFIRSNIYVDNGQQVPNKNAVQGYAFTHQERTLVTNELHVDASSYLYSGLVSFLDALQGLQAGFYSWADSEVILCDFLCLPSIFSRM